MVKNLKILNRFMLIFAFMSSSLMAQYWQQDVEYIMDISLDSDAKVLTGFSQLTYINNSPDSLDHIYMHLYHNAFNEGTIAKEVWADYGDYFPNDKDWTGISIQNAQADSTTLEFIIRDDTILDISLNHVLAPNDTLNFSLNWRSNIHKHIDRSGWEGEQFDFAQWYPKFVVYDETGWHNDPFGDWGEFYGEFGNFTVNLDLPIGHIVGATGLVIAGDPGWSEVTVDTSVAWEEWLTAFEKKRERELLEQDVNERRQVTFYAENVHDFAWLCSPNFVYESGSWNDIEVHALFTTSVGHVWTKDVVEDGISALRWLSEKFGAYPWPQMTITKALLSGGMEYPMLIMDVSDSESLIVHEIGHNWFYGLFGNDELDDAWLDEGFTSFQTIWYKTHHYPQNGYDRTRNYITEFEAENLPRQFYWEAAFKPALRYMLTPLNEPVATHSYDYINDGSYRTNVYTKASFMLYSLMGYLGEDTFLAGMSIYYDHWALKHVNEARFIRAMEEASGEELDWFFDQWLHTTDYVDYALVDWKSKQVGNIVSTEIFVRNEGGMFVPIAATLYGENGEEASTSLVEFKHRVNTSMNIETSFKPVKIILDAENVFLDVDRRNNTSEQLHAIRYNYKGWDAYPNDRNLYLWKPQFGLNDSHGFGLGLRIDQVYRNTGNFTALELDYNLASQKTDVALTFNKIQVGLPFRGTWAGDVGTWHELNFASLQYELVWAKEFWVNPVHYLTLGSDYTDAVDLAGGSNSFTRFKLKYELQHDIFRGDYGLGVKLSFSPDVLGGYSEDFFQFSIMDSWIRNFAYFKFENRTNFMYNSSNTPEYVKYRVATQDLRSIYLNRGASTLNNIQDITQLTSRNYLPGGARIRAYTDSLNISANYIWSNNLDLTFKTFQPYPKKLHMAMFIDFGQSSMDGKNWTWLGGLGMNITYKPYWKRTSWLTTIIRPVQLKVQVPLARYTNGHVENAVSSDLWVFTISN